MRYRYQIRIARAVLSSVIVEPKDVYIKISRQAGKTETITLLIRFLIIFYRLLTGNSLMCAFSSPKGEQAKTDVDRVKKSIVQLRDRCMKKRFLVIEGRVNSKHDREVHFISAERLMKLYGVDPTWGEYATKYSFQERFRKDQKEHWEKYHAEREAKQQQVLDKVAGTFEAVFDVVANMAVKHIENLDSPVKLTRNRAEAALTKMFGSMDAVDKFYRMYLCARGQPEKITKLEHDGQIATTYLDLDDKPKAKTPDEAKRLAEENAKH